MVSTSLACSSRSDGSVDAPFELLGELTVTPGSPRAIRRAPLATIWRGVASVIELGLLRQVQDASAAPPIDRPFVGGLGAGENRKQRRFAGAVRPQETYPVAAPHGESDVRKQRLRPVGFGQVTCADDGHGALCSTFIVQLVRPWPPLLRQPRFLSLDAGLPLPGRGALLRRSRGERARGRAPTIPAAMPRGRGRDLR